MLLIAAGLIVLAITAIHDGLISFRSDDLVENQPLRYPTRVESVLSDQELMLDGSRLVRLQYKVSNLADRIAESGFLVEVVGRGRAADGVECVEIYVRAEVVSACSDEVRLRIPLLPSRQRRYARVRLLPE